MPQTTQQPQPSPDALRADSVLIQKVAVPAFFEKMAAVGISPSDPGMSDEALRLCDTVVPAVKFALDRYLAAEANSKLAVVKTAFESAKAVIGPERTPSAPASNPESFLVDADVKAAADALVAEQLKQANLANLLGNTQPAKTESEEEPEEEAKKKTMNMGASCA